MAALSTAKILSDDEVTAVAGGLRGLLGEEFLRESKGFDLENFVRFQAVAEKCRQAREARGLTMKQAAQALGVRQKDLRRIESASVGDLDWDLLVQYMGFLGLQRWFGRWKSANPDAVARLGIAAPRRK
jgi:DNA-binding XRE family transcriptional regulator